MQDQVLLKVTVITDDSTGIYNVGELDFGVPYTTKDYLDKPGNREKLTDWLLWLSNQGRNSEAPFEPRMTEQEIFDLQGQMASAALPNKSLNADPKSGPGDSSASSAGE